MAQALQRLALACLIGVASASAAQAQDAASDASSREERSNAPEASSGSWPPGDFAGGTVKCYIGGEVRTHTDIYRVSFARFSTLVFLDADKIPEH